VDELDGLPLSSCCFLKIQRQGNNAIVTYRGTLESAPSLVGPWTTVAGANSPYSTAATGPMRFFRSMCP
jgi:hypothetical protein